MDFAAMLFEAYSRRCSVSVPEGLSMVSLAGAYELQDAVVALHEAAGARVAGWKLGITSEVKQTTMGIDHPLYGRIFADGQLESGSSVRCDDLISPRVEPEIAFALRGTIEPNMREPQLIDAVDWLAPAIEITDSRYAAGRRTAVELVADNTSAAKYVLGERYSAGSIRTLDETAVTLWRNGTLLASGKTADVLGNPLRALTFLASHLRERGFSAGAGLIVMSGAITDAFPVAAGDVIKTTFAGLSSTTVCFV